MGSFKNTDSLFEKTLLFTGFAVFLFAVSCHLGDRFMFFAWDEMDKCLLSLEIIDVLKGREQWSLLFNFKTTELPCMMYNDYVGVPWTWISVGFVMLFGKGVGSFMVFKIFTVLCGIVTLISILFVVRELFGRREAVLCVFMLATNCVFIEGCRFSFWCEEIGQITGLWLGVMLCLLYDKTKNRMFLCLGFVVFGITLWAKIMFVGYMLSFCVGLFVLGKDRKAVLSVLFPSARQTAVNLLCFAVGAAPFLYYNLRYRLSTFVFLWHNLIRDLDTAKIDDGWNNWAVLSNLVQRFTDAGYYISGGIFSVFTWKYNFLFVGLVALALLYGFVRIYSDKDSKESKQLKFLIASYGCLLCLTCYVPIRHLYCHIMIMIPFFELICAVFIVRCLSLIKKKSIFFLLGILFCGSWLAVQAVNISYFLSEYANGTGESISFGPTVVEAKAFTQKLEEEGVERLIAFRAVAPMLRCCNAKWNVRKAWEFRVETHIWDLCLLGPNEQVISGRKTHLILFDGFHPRPTQEQLNAILAELDMEVVSVKKGYIDSMGKYGYQLFALRPLSEK